jgi:hypothetical protein
VKFLCGDRRVGLQRQLGQRLADVPVAVHDLRDGESLFEQMAAVDRRCVSDSLEVRGRGLHTTQRR